MAGIRPSQWKSWDRCQRLVREHRQSAGFDVNHSILILKCSFDQEKLCASDDKALTFIEVGSDDGVSDARFILHGQEDEPLCSSRTLPGNDASGCTYVLAVSATA
jgi:hypothetical protein